MSSFSKVNVPYIIKYISPWKDGPGPGFGDGWSRNKSGSSGRRAAVTDGPGYLRCATLARRRWQYFVSRPASESWELYSTLWREADIFLFTHCLELRTTGREHTERHDGTAQLFCSIKSGRQMTQEMPPDPDTFSVSHEQITITFEKIEYGS